MSEMIHVLAASYDRREDALSAYEAIDVAYKHVGHGHQIDVTVLGKDADGKVEVVRRHDSETHDRTTSGLGWGLAIGAVTAIFPAVGIFSAMAVGGGAGAALGALAGHASRTLSRDDLKSLGEVLDRGDGGLVVAYGPDMADRVTSAVAGATSKVHVTTDISVEELASELRSAMASAS
jgi:uncharacterized membrane protein